MADNDDDDDKTVFGQPLPPPPLTPHPLTYPPGSGWNVYPQNPSGTERTAFGQTASTPGTGVPPTPRSPGPHPFYQPGTGQRSAAAGIFPEIRRPEAAPRPAAQARIALDDALRAADAGRGAASNPLLAEATQLLILLGRLRTGLVEMQAGPLIDHVTREIDDIERRCLAAGLPASEVRDAKYALSATADDIVQNLPGADRAMWLQYSMVARFFGERSSGVGFFRKMDEAMKAPGQRYHLLELMLVCLSLGFEGQYRAMPSGAAELARIRSAIYETLRRISPRPDDDVSPHWTAVPLDARRRGGQTPLWVIAAIAAAMLVALFATLSTLLTRQGATVRDDILALHAGQPEIAIERTEPVIAPYQAPETTQMDRIRTALAEPLETGRVEVDQVNDWVLVRLREALRFATGSADLGNGSGPLLAEIAAMLDGEDGPVRVVGHTDSVPMSGRGRFRSNHDLSLARAETVAERLGALVADPARLSAEGKGATDPVAGNDTPEGRAMNRRVEIMIPRED